MICNPWITAISQGIDLMQKNQQNLKKSNHTLALFCFQAKKEELLEKHNTGITVKLIIPDYSS